MLTTPRPTRGNIGSTTPEAASLPASSSKVGKAQLGGPVSPPSGGGFTNSLFIPVLWLVMDRACAGVVFGGEGGRKLSKPRSGSDGTHTTVMRSPSWQGTSLVGVAQRKVRAWPSAHWSRISCTAAGGLLRSWPVNESSCAKMDWSLDNSVDLTSTTLPAVRSYTYLVFAQRTCYVAHCGCITPIGAKGSYGQ